MANNTVQIFDNRGFFPILTIDPALSRQFFSRVMTAFAFAEGLEHPVAMFKSERHIFTGPLSVIDDIASTSVDDIDPFCEISAVLAHHAPFRNFR